MRYNSISSRLTKSVTESKETGKSLFSIIDIKYSKINTLMYHIGIFTSIQVRTTKLDYDSRKLSEGQRINILIL